MRIISVDVSNYRSIVKHTQFNLGDMTTLVGPNNEGETNLIKALIVGMHEIEALAKGGEDPMYDYISPISFYQYNMFDFRKGYRWDLDYPLSKQSAKRSGRTIIRLTFKLDGDEIATYESLTGSHTSDGILPIEMEFTKTKKNIGIKKRGMTKKIAQTKSKEIAKFITDNFGVIYIPAVRTEKQARSILNELIVIRMESLFHDEKYQELLKKLEEHRRDVISNIANDIKKSVRQYMPSVNGVLINPENFSSSASRVSRILIDDGVRTMLEQKGDGIKSLFTMALIQELSREKSSVRNYLLAVDEPEAHLHPNAVRDLQGVFETIARDRQVLIATHHPLMVNRDSVQSNILVRGNTATAVKALREIRKSLGVQLSDNLSSAELVVLVEGVSDERILPHIIKQIEPDLFAYVRNRRIVFINTHGASKMISEIERQKASICKVFVVLDADETGRKVSAGILDKKLMPVSRIHLLGMDGGEGEIEDIINPDVYIEGISEYLGTTVNPNYFLDPNKKWSQKFKNMCNKLGFPFTEDVMREVKTRVADCTIQFNGNPVKEDTMENVQVLMSRLSEYIKE